MAQETVALARKHLGINDPQAVQLTLAAAVSVYDQGDPLWPMLIGPASAGKTTILSLTKFLGAWVLDDPTVAGLLGWGREGEQSGLLTQIAKAGGKGLVVIPDLSPILAGSEKGNADKLFAHLRRVYDGSTSRTHGKGDLAWEGRVVVLAACTSAIDRYGTYGGELGPRFVYLRMPEEDAVSKMSAMRRRVDRIRQLAEVQTSARRSVERGMFALSTVTLSERLMRTVEVATLVCTYGRSSVPRDYRHDVVGLSETEAPWRLLNQLEALARACVALGMDDDEVEALVNRVARDSMPIVRFRVLSYLAQCNGTPPSTAEVSKHVRGSASVIGRCLEDLSLSEMVRLEQAAEGLPTKWFITDTFKSLIPFVFKF